MKTYSNSYSPVAQDGSSDCDSHYFTPRPSSGGAKTRTGLFIVAFTLSVAHNIYTILIGRLSTGAQESVAKTVQLSSELTPFAKLEWDKWVMYEHGGLYVNDTEEVTNAAWEAIPYDTGNVALDDDYVAEMGLPVSQRFPWDNKKGLYFMNAQHQIHCLAALRKSFFQLRDNIPLDLAWEHNMHCFNALRQEVMCTADDTPRSMTFAHPGSIGVGQWRRCRDWDKMVEWTRERWSCWRDINKTDHIDTLLRYRYCPKGSPYYDRIHAIFGDFDMGEMASADT